MQFSLSPFLTGYINFLPMGEKKATNGGLGERSTLLYVFRSPPYVVVVYQCSVSNVMVNGDIEAFLYSKVHVRMLETHPPLH